MSSALEIFWVMRYINVRFTYLLTSHQNREITRNSDKIWPYSSSRSSKVSEDFCLTGAI